MATRFARNEAKRKKRRSRSMAPRAAGRSLEDARRAGLLDGDKTEHLSFRAPPALMEARRDARAGRPGGPSSAFWRWPLLPDDYIARLNTRGLGKATASAVAEQGAA